MSDESDGAGLLHRSAEESAERTARAEAVYDALRTTGKLSSHRILGYRCPRRCSLLDVLQLPDGLVIASPRYKVSPGRNEATSNEPGRAANTEDGDRRWSAQVYYAVDAANFTVNCDHVAGEVIDKQDVESDRSKGRTEVVWPRIPGTD